MASDSFFDVAGERFFSVFAYSNRRIYESALYIIREEYAESDQNCIMRSRISELLQRYLLPSISSGDFSEEESEYGILDEDELKNKISYIIRNLIKAGWLDEMPTDELENGLIMPPHANLILKNMLSTASRRGPQYESQAYTIYSVLSNAYQEKSGQSMIAALDSAYDDTVNLRDSLRFNINAMRRVGQKILEREEADDIYASFRKDFQEKIVEEYINPLVSMKNQKWYEQKILNILNEWYYSDMSFFLFEQRVRLITSDEESFKKRCAEIRLQLRKTIEYYSQLEKLTSLMYATQEKIMQQSLLRLRYRLSHGSGDDMLTLVNNLLATLKDESDTPFGLRIFSLLSSSWNFSSTSLVDSASFYTLPLEDGDEKSTSLKTPPVMDDEEKERKIEEFYDKIEINYDDSVVMRAFSDGVKEVRASDLKIDSTDEYSSLLYAAVRGLDEDAPYESIWDDAMEEIEISGFKVTNYHFRLREKR